MTEKREFVAIDGTIMKYEWRRHKKKDAIEVIAEIKGKMSHILINARLGEITFLGEIDWKVGKIVTDKNGFKMIRLKTEDEFARDVAKRL
jgi:hypothetical protein